MVRCDNCETAQLVELESEDGIAGFMCEDATEEQREAGSGCGVVITQEEMQERRKAEGKTATKQRLQQKKPAAAILQSDDEEEEEEEEQRAAVGVSVPRNKENVSINLPGKSSSSSSRKSLHRAAARCQPLAPASSSSSGLSSYSASFRSKLKQQAASRLSGSSFDLDDHADDVAALNSAALREGGTMQLQRASVMPQLLSIKGDENCVAEKYRRAFVPPRAGAQPPSREAQQLMAKEKWGRRLGVRVRGYGLLGQQLVKPLVVLPTPVEPPRVELKVDSEADAAAVRRKDGFEPLIVWTQAQLTDDDRQRHPGRQWSDSIEVPPCVARFLRPHQRDGVQFMAECVLGLRRFQGSGAILADDMGLGKSLQSVALLYTLLTQGFEQGRPTCRRVVVVTPTSLVANWGKELHKWLQDRVSAVAISESTRDDVVQAVAGFLHPRSTSPVLIISYDTFRLHSSLFMKAPADSCCDLLICDEAHRLKNSKTATYAALDALPCQRRVLLSGTPLQNNLDEFFAMISFTNRAVLGERRMFRRYYEQPILAGREPLADQEEQQDGMMRSAELSAIVNQFVLRRTNTLLSAHLPPKVMQILCCRPTGLQVRLYDHLLKSKEVRRVVRGEDGSSSSRADALPLINALKSLCNHPKIVYDLMQGRPVKDDAGGGGGSGKAMRRILSGCEQYFRDSGFERNPTAASWSGKMNVLEKLLSVVRRTTDDRVVIVAVWTSALDVMEAMCRLNRWPFLRLDGATAMKKRQKLVDELSDRQRDSFCFLLSSKAGGCGLNLIGANRLVLFDPDWNPAVDKQAAARIWRDGQSKRCFIYRLLTTGSIEEKVYQRQLSKEGLADVLGGGMNEAACTQDELRELFQRRSGESASDTHDHLQCDCLDGIMTSEEEAKEKREMVKRMEEEDKERQRQQRDSEQKTSEQQQQDEEKAAPEVIDAEQPSKSPPPSDSESDDDGFVVADGSDPDSEGDYDAPSRSSGGSKGGKKAKKAKRGERRRSLKTSLVLDPLLLSSITKAMIGQRGAPPEDELVNWAHHITAMSAPDPLLRQAVQGMSRTRDGQQFVSFVFSCEVKGKQIGATGGQAGEQHHDDSDEEQTAETREFAQYSARCSLPPVVKERTAGLSISADEALEKHHKMIEEHEKRRRKRLGQQDAEDGDTAQGGRERRHSTRVTHRSSLSEEALANQQLDGAGGAAGEGGAGGDARRGRKRAVAELELEDALSKVDAADAAAIKLALQEEEINAGRKRGRHSSAAAQHKKAAEKQQEVDQQEEEEEEEAAGDEEQDAGQPARRNGREQAEEEEEEEEEDDDVIDLSKPPAAAARPSSHRDVKMRKEEQKQKQDDDDEDDYEEEEEDEEEEEEGDDSSVEVVAVQKQKHRAQETIQAGRAEDRRYAIKPVPAAAPPAVPAVKQTASRQPVKPPPPARAAPAAVSTQPPVDDDDDFF